jgi:hypothetical protein
VTRDEHVEWCKQRAREYLDRGDTVNAFTSMGSDLSKHPETQNHKGVEIGLQLMMIGSLSTVPEMRKFIEGFN